MVSATIVLRQPDRGDGDEPAEHRSAAAARAGQPGHVPGRGNPADLLVPDHCRHAALRHRPGDDGSAHPHGGVMQAPSIDTELTVSDVQGTVAEERVAVASNWQLVWWRFRKHHLALFSAWLLACMYCVVICPAFFSTQDPQRTDARQAFIPVQTLHLLDGGWNPWVPAITGKRNPVTLRMEWTTDPQRKVHVSFFTRGEPYRLFGLFNTNVHLLGAADPTQRIFLLGSDRLGRD